METLIYLGKVNLYWVVFYICYRLFLHRHTFFVWNRAYLLSSLILAVALPAIHLPEKAPVIVESAAYIANTLPTYPTIQATESLSIPWEQVIFIVISLGVTFMLARLLHALRILFKIIRQGDNIPFDDHTLVLLPHSETGSFSFFSWLVVNQNDYENNLDLVLRHELIHINQMHSFDILFIELLKVLCWFNPVLWFYKHSLQEVHEFLADETAPNRERYATFLVSYGLHGPLQSLTNHFFNSSLLKNRIAMIYKTRTSNWLLGKYAMIIPVTLIVILCTASYPHETPRVKTIVEKINNLNPYQGVNEEAATPASEVKTEGKTVNETVDIKGVILDELGKPVSRVTLLLANKLLGKTDENGRFQLQNIDVNSSISVSHVSFVPQQFVAKKTLSNYNLTLTRNKIMLNEVVVLAYGMSAKNSAMKPAGPDSSDLGTSVQIMPEFPGGAAEMYKYIGKKVHYPTEASRENIQGRVFVSFTVNENGNIRNPRVVKGLGGGTDEEALRVVLGMPTWKPAEQNGQKVSADYAISINFALEN